MRGERQNQKKSTAEKNRQLGRNHLTVRDWHDMRVDDSKHRVENQRYDHDTGDQPIYGFTR